MKNLFLTLVTVLSALTSIYAQEGFSVQAGLSLVNASVEIEGEKASDSETGFFIGGAYQFELSETIAVQPAVLFSSVKDLSSLYIPVMFKYHITEQLDVQAGPEVNYLLEDVDQGAFGIDLALGATYDISDKLYATARYGFEILRDIDDFNLNTLQIGIGYNFDL